MTVSTASVNRLRVTCRRHPTPLRTSYSFSPHSLFPISKHSSIAHRRPATCTSTRSCVSGGPPQTKDATSAGSVVLRRISSQRASVRRSGLLTGRIAQSYVLGPFVPAPPGPRHRRHRDARPRRWPTSMATVPWMLRRRCRQPTASASCSTSEGMPPVDPPLSWSQRAGRRRRFYSPQR